MILKVNLFVLPLLAVLPVLAVLAVKWPALPVALTNAIEYISMWAHHFLWCYS